MKYTLSTLDAHDAALDAALVTAGNIAPLVMLLEAKPVQRDAAGTLWNFSSNSGFHVTIVSAGAIGLIALLRSPSSSVLECAARSLQNLGTNDANNGAIVAAVLHT